MPIRRSTLTLTSERLNLRLFNVPWCKNLMRCRLAIIVHWSRVWHANFSWREFVAFHCGKNLWSTIRPMANWGLSFVTPTSKQALSHACHQHHVSHLNFLWPSALKSWATKEADSEKYTDFTTLTLWPPDPETSILITSLVPMSYTVMLQL